jgi:preprotein translocase subunit SecB
MQPSLLQIKSLQVTRLQFEAFPEPYESAPLLSDHEVTVFRHKENAGDWVVTLTISFGGTERPQYRGSLSLTGEFSTSEEIDSVAAINLVNVNGPAILYSTAREILFSITARAPHGGWMLPSVTFIDRMVKAPTNSPEKSEPKAEPVTK